MDAIYVKQGDSLGRCEELFVPLDYARDRMRGYFAYESFEIAPIVILCETKT